MSDRDCLEATCLLQAPDLTWLPEPLQLRLTISRQSAVAAPLPAVATPTGGHAPYTRQYTIKLSEENWQGLCNLAYWRRGRMGSKVAILNQAVALYLARYEEASRPAPEKEHE